MGKLLYYASERHQLYEAWRRIRENGYASRSEKTRKAVELFERTANRDINRIQKRLRDNTFKFDPQIGVSKKKSSGGKRGIVMASIHNRIVERAWLDCLQSKSNFVKSVINLPTSIGGVPDRSVPHGLKLIDECIKNGYRYFVRSDISGFFDSVPRDAVLKKIKSDVDDERFLKVLDEATTVTLQNEIELGEDRGIFPTDYEGIAQGSPLSPLFGNILLYDFDTQFNKDGVVCVRFIDDFILMSKEQKRATKAFQSAQRHLSSLGLKCHDPFSVTANPLKSQQGNIDSGFVFLGYDIRPGLFQPSAAARKELLKDIRERIKTGRRDIISIKREAHSENSQRYMQTLNGIDRALRGWGNAFSYHNAPSTMEQLDVQVDEELTKFRLWYTNLLKGQDWKVKRRTGGVCLVSDIKTKNLQDVPFKIKQGGRFVRSSKTITISTDGSVAGSVRKRRDVGPGGWAFVVHETGAESSGTAENVTNNQMELQAVIEAIKAAAPGKSIYIRTDSQYVHQLAKGEGIVKSNPEMWREYQSLIKGRNIKIVWIKGHSGDSFNERADALANARALEGARLVNSF